MTFEEFKTKVVTTYPPKHKYRIEYDGGGGEGTHDGASGVGTQHYRQTDFVSCYVFLDGKIYNLLFMNDEATFRSWVYATQQMTEQNTNEFFHNTIKDKECRVKLFEGFKNKTIW